MKVKKNNYMTCKPLRVFLTGSLLIKKLLSDAKGMLFLIMFIIIPVITQAAIVTLLSNHSLWEVYTIFRISAIRRETT